jgi:enterochelin esterase-like enzyme
MASSTSAAPAGPDAHGDRMTFRLADPDGEYDHVAVRMDLTDPAEPSFDAAPAMTRTGAEWHVAVRRPPAHRIEYRFEVRRRDGAVGQIGDPANPCTASGPFGERSVVELPGYAAPHWVGAEAPAGDLRWFQVPLLGSAVPLGLWQAARLEPDEPAPLLVVHDGPELVEYAGLTRYLDVMTAAGEIPAGRAALLGPTDQRDDLYGASPAYSGALSTVIGPLLEHLSPVGAEHAIAGMGVSLGALAMLHAHRRDERLFDGLFLQSGSFYLPGVTHPERDFRGYTRISAFVHTLLEASRARRPIPAVLTCGTAEENLPDNKVIARTLERQGYDVALHLHPDAHNWVSWRDALHPHLTGLLRRLWGGKAERPRHRLWDAGT